MKLRLFARLPQPVGPVDDESRTHDEPVWSMPSARTCRGVQLVHVGQVMSCTADTCPDVEAKHPVSFRCIVMANPCPACGAHAWGH